MTKDKKVSEDRIYDGDGFWLRAACVCVKDETENEVLLVSSSACPNNWIIPGGKIQQDERAEESAEREAREEAGVVGRLGRCLGLFDNKDRRHRTTVFVLIVKDLLDQYDDSQRRKRCWFGVDAAMETLKSYKPLHCNYISAMRGHRPIHHVEKNQTEKTENEQKR